MHLAERSREGTHNERGGNTQEDHLPWKAPGPGAEAQRTAAEGFQHKQDWWRLRAVLSGFGTEFVTGAQKT